MTWKQLIGKIREGLGESSARIRMLGDLLAETGKDETILDAVDCNIVFSLLILAVSDLHSTVEMLAIGLDAVVETLRERNKSQEVKSD